MQNSKFDFSNTNVVITGGASGIGFRVTSAFLQAGAHVCVWDYSEESLRVAEKELDLFKASLSFKQVDVTKRESIAQAAASLPGPVDVLINNAGITRDKSFAKLSEEDWDAVISTNLTGLFNVTKGLFDKFNSPSKNKRIINISSVVGLYGNFGQSNYASAKAGVIGFTKTLGKELGRKGFTVNAIAPGFIRTAMTNAMPKEALLQMESKVPMARLGEVDDIANACLFLSSEEASYINAAVLSVDGGIVL